MIYNTNTVHRIDDNSEILESFIKIVNFNSLDITHEVKAEIALYTNLDKYTSDEWRISALRLVEFKERNANHFSFPYFPITEEGKMDIDKGQTMWWVYEQVRLALLEKFPEWDETKLVNLVPKIVFE